MAQRANKETQEELERRANKAKRDRWVRSVKRAKRARRARRGDKACRAIWGQEDLQEPLARHQQPQDHKAQRESLAQRVHRLLAQRGKMLRTTFIAMTAAAGLWTYITQRFSPFRIVLAQPWVARSH